LEQEHHTVPVYSQIYWGIVYLEVMPDTFLETVWMVGFIPAFINFKIRLEVVGGNMVGVNPVLGLGYL